MASPLQADAARTVAPGAAADDALYRRIGTRIVPFLFVCYIVSILDRSNIGFAQLQMREDLGLTDAMYSLGAVLFFVGYVLFEVPSNALLRRFGARRTFARIMFLWGSVSVAMIAVDSAKHFYVLRFLLGVFEAGFFPGVVFYLTYWYPARRRASVLSVFYAGVAVAGMIGGLLSGWIMRGMSGVLGLHGWQWMFAIEGAPAVVLGVIAWFWLCDRPEHARWLSDDDRQRLAADLAADRAAAPAGGARSLRQVLAEPRTYLFAFIYFSLTTALLMLLFWMPLMIREFGIRDVVQISLLSIVPNAIGAAGLIAIARRSDRRRERRRHFAACALGGAVALALLTLHLPNLVAMMALLSIAAMLIFAAHPVFWAVPSAYFSGAGAAGAIALISSIGVSSGMITPWIVGVIRTKTGSMDPAMLMIAALLAACAVAMLIGVRAAPQGSADARGSAAV
ncbi:MFS transporter [Burkholderia multivorans]|uniref:MFS transporter n=1 Tax=Burkholderia multivorans TaxID=87883 RepID=UPI001C23BD0A|nr:MFS transporter [Burkholderia multivorans]MBU9147996.1 MFS transporter [Burkholderia multivorans]MBU9481732.1 MFS transporter [Burkholderia multivorans]